MDLISTWFEAMFGIYLLKLRIRLSRPSAGYENPVRNTPGQDLRSER